MVNDLSSRFIEVVQYLTKNRIVSGNKDFASKIGVSNSMITEIFKGRSNVGVSAIQNTVLLFSIDANWLLTGRGSMLGSIQSNEQIIDNTSKQSVEESMLYKMYQQEKAEKEAKIEEIGALKERIRQLEHNDCAVKTSVKVASTKKSSIPKADDAGSAIVR